MGTGVPRRTQRSVPTVYRHVISKNPQVALGQSGRRRGLMKSELGQPSELESGFVYVQIVKAHLLFGGTV